ncbi:HAMP domain-containing protein [Streptacidiphilus anmyonensis]|uniref:HAMP domain-containing protein n=1 Tax=Streptacidiphilus anmyonensis TaxID=405782 RepID=UPI0005AA4F2A|nr:HAMP domain-containing sensor histidine kinase [Streptacidiphilus anmyonensis]
MRRSLAGVALAVTLMVALSFLLPLGVLVRTEARGQHIAAAEQRAAALAPVLTLTTDTDQLTAAIASLDSTGGLGVRLPDGQQLGSDHSPSRLLARAAAQRASITQDIPGGWVYLQPVVLPQGRVAVIEEYLPAAQLTDGVAASWGVMALLTVCLVAGSMFVADRLGAQVVRSSRRLSLAAQRIGSGDLDSRVDPSGPPELRRVGSAFNVMADRVVELLAVERELVADLSHRLRTPLTALHLAAERMGPTPDAQRVAAAVDQLESELEAIIAAARTPLATGPMGRALQPSETGPDRGSGRPQGSSGGRGRDRGRAGVLLGRERTVAPVCQAGEVVERRAGFWATLAEHQGRPCEVRISAEPTPVNLSADDLGAVVDALVGNVFRHTPAGTAFTVDVARTALAVELTLEDAGPGIADPESALTRGSSDGSTGLGLDIALRAAIATRGDLRITRGELGGARITLTLGLASATPPRPRGLTPRRAVR